MTICREVSRLEQASSRRCIVGGFETETLIHCRHTSQIEVRFPQASRNPLMSRYRGRHYGSRNWKSAKAPPELCVNCQNQSLKQQLVSAMVQCIGFLSTEGEDEKSLDRRTKNQNPGEMGAYCVIWRSLSPPARAVTNGEYRGTQLDGLLAGYTIRVGGGLGLLA